MYTNDENKKKRIIRSQYFQSRLKKSATLRAIDNNHDQITVMIRKEGSLFRRDPLLGRKSRPFLVHSRFECRKSCEHDYDMIGNDRMI